MLKACAAAATLLALAVFSLPQASAEAPGKLYEDGWVPFELDIRGARSGTVHLCKIDHTAHARQPDKIPMFRDMAHASNCKAGARSVPLGEFRDAMRKLLDAHAAGEVPTTMPPPVPTGFVFHEGRVGSTLVANMLASSESHAVYPESQPPVQVMTATALSQSERVALLQEVVAGMTRVPGCSATFFKFQSVVSSMPTTALAAFPTTPWVFLYRFPAEVMASMFQTLSHPEKLVGGGPCMRHRANPKPYVSSLLAADGKDGRSASPAQFCAAHLANLCVTMLNAVQDSEGHGLALDYRLLPDLVPEVLRQHFNAPLTSPAEARMMDVARTYSKGRGKRPGAFEGDAEAKRASVPQEVNDWAAKYMLGLYGELAAHTLATVSFLGPEAQEAMQAGVAAAEGAQRPPQARRLQDEADPQYDLDAAGAGASFTAAWRSIRGDLEKAGELAPRDPLAAAAAGRARALGSTGGARSLAQVPAGVDPDTWPKGFANPPPDSLGARVKSTAEGLPPPGYPVQYSLVDMLKAWDADDVWIPQDYGRFSSVKTLHWETDQAEATLYREMEVPFVLRGVPALQKAVEKWDSDAYMIDSFGSKNKMVEHSKNNHHMFYARGRRNRDPNWKPPTEDIYIPFKDWLSRAKKVGSAIRSGELVNNATEHYYFRVSSAERYPDGSPVSRKGDLFDNAFIGQDLAMFNREESLFIVQPDQQKGIHCRFGMEGVMAECHYDAGRNYVAIMHGMKRYILSSPDECANLDLYSKGPSARHTKGNWGDIVYAKEKLNNAMATEVILQAGDMLYIPSGWFHHIISLTLNYQCNSRSGNPHIWQREIQQCGFRLGTPEPDYKERHEQRLSQAKAQYAAMHAAPIKPAQDGPDGKPVGLRGGA